MDFPFTIPEDSMFNDGFDGFDVSIPASPAVPVYQQIQQFSYPQIPQAQQPAVYQQIQQFFPIPQITQPEQDRRQRKINQYFKPAPQQEEPAPQPDTSSLEAALTEAVERYSSSEELSSRPSSPSSSSANNSESETELSSTESDLSLSSASTSSSASSTESETEFSTTSSSLTSRSSSPSESETEPAPQAQQPATQEQEDEEPEENRRVYLANLPLGCSLTKIYQEILATDIVPAAIQQIPDVNAVHVTFNSAEEAEQFIITVNSASNIYTARLAARPFKEDPKVNQYRRLNAPTLNDSRSMARYFDREYIQTDQANAVRPCRSIDAPRNPKLEHYGQSLGRKIHTSKCRCIGVKYLQNGERGEPLFSVKWNETIESIASFQGVDWCWFFAQNIDVDNRTMQCLYTRFQEINKPPNGLKDWPETPEEAFHQSFMEYTAREDHDQMIRNACEDAEQELRRRRMEEAEEFYSRKGRIGRKSRRIY